VIGVRSFHDLPLWAKVLIGPVAGIVSGVAVAASIWLGATETRGRLADIADYALPTAAASAQLFDVVDTIEATAMRAMVWQLAGVPKATIDALGQDVVGESNALRAGVAAMVAHRSDDDADMPRLKAIAAESEEYAKQVGDALDLLADPAIAVG
jgi:hypothetical protein